MLGMLSSIWRYRFFIISSILTEFKSRFVRSKLGGAWMVLNPLLQVLIFAFVLSSVMAARLPGVDNKYAYAIYLMAGTLGWSLFTEVLTRCVNVFVEQGGLLKKLVFPKITLPLIVTGSAMVTNILLLIAILIIFGFLGHWPTLALLWLPFLMLVTILLALGLGLILGVLNVFVRDISQVVPVLTQLLFWFTPIVYVANIIPVEYKPYLVYNPMIAIITGYQDVLLYNKMPNLLELIPISIVALILLLVSLLLVRKANAEMVDQL